MALGEYVSVSSQRDTELGQYATEERELQEALDTELAELTTTTVRPARWSVS